MRKKICFIIYSLGNGGAERVLSTLSNYFVKTNEVTIVTFKNDTPYYELDENIVVKSIDSDVASKNIFEAIKNNMQTIIKLTKTIKKVNSDVVISFMTTSNILATIACKIISKPIIISERINYDFVSSRIWQSIRRFIYKFSNHLVVQSEYDLNKYSFVKEVSIIENPLFLSTFRNEKRKNYFLAVGRLDIQKGFDILIEAYSQLDTTWKLKIVGEGKERASLENQIERLKLSKKVALLGRKNDVEFYYNEAGIFILSSRMEGYPNVLIEAMACACPSVAFACKTGPSSIIEDGINGILVKAEDVEELSKSMKRLIDDEELRDNLGEKAKDIKDKLNIENIASQWMDIIEKVKKV